MASPSKRAIAQQEKERLRLQAKQKKELLSNMRMQNDSAVQGEVRCQGQQHVTPNSSHPDQTRKLDFAAQAERAQNRMQFLLKQAEIFQHFAPPKAR
jgi:SWI/SNF-related matrix-associated actin-dependent regulator of chromatin subfamily A member 5